MPALILTKIENSYKGFPVVVVREVKNPTYKESVPVGSIVTMVGEQQVDGISLDKISDIVSQAARPLTVRFRDPSR